MCIYDLSGACCSYITTLYVNAAQMVASSDAISELSTVVIRLGGFQLIMSFMGAVGTIMG